MTNGPCPVRSLRLLCLLFCSLVSAHGADALQTSAADLSGSHIRDYGLKPYVRTSQDLPRSEDRDWKLVCILPHNSQFQQWIRFTGPSGLILGCHSSNPLATDVHHVTSHGGEQIFETPNWVSGEGAIYDIPAGITVHEVQYQETGFETDFAGSFECNDNDYNVLWQRSARTTYLCMRQFFYDCPDRERCDYISDGVISAGNCYYAYDPRSHYLCQKLAVHPIAGKDGYQGQALQYFGDYGLWNYYLQTGDLETLTRVYDATKHFLLVQYPVESAQWVDWGKSAGDPVIVGKCFYYIALNTLKKVAKATGQDTDIPEIESRLRAIKDGFDQTYWKGHFYQSGQNSGPDDRANAMAVLSGLADASKWIDIYDHVLSKKENSSCFFDRWVYEALVVMGKPEAALMRMSRRYKSMIDSSFSTLWEHFDRVWMDHFDDNSTLNHGWNSPVTVLSMLIGGIAPETPGWATYHVLPHEAFLTSLKEVVSTVKGEVRLEIAKTASTYSLTLTSPARTLAVVGIPKASFTTVKSIHVNGRAIWQGTFGGGVEGVTWKGEDDHFITFNVSPGTWTFIAHGDLPTASPKPPAVPSDRGVLLNQKSWTASASTPTSEYLCGAYKVKIDVSAANALDGDPWTGWRDMTGLQHPGQWWQVDMRKKEIFDHIVLDTTWAIFDTPDAYSITVSNDGQQWSQPVATGRGELGITTVAIPRQTARYIRVTQTGTKAFNWSIYEMRVYRKQ
jgi:hypothetical protein